MIFVEIHNIDVWRVYVGRYIIYVFSVISGLVKTIIPLLLKIKILKFEVKNSYF